MPNTGALVNQLTSSIPYVIPCWTVGSIFAKLLPARLTSLCLRQQPASCVQVSFNLVIVEVLRNLDVPFSCCCRL